MIFGYFSQINPDQVPKNKTVRLQKLYHSLQKYRVNMTALMLGRMGCEYRWFSAAAGLGES